MSYLRLLVLGVIYLTSANSFLCPVAAKTKRTIYTPELLQKAKHKVATLDWAKNQVITLEGKSRFFTQMSDEELWNYIPPAGQLRALNVHFGSDCPVHGAAIHRKGGHYPWIMSRDKPFKLQCPVGQEIYPSNDFQPWWTKSKTPVTPENSSPREKYVDHGAGWVDEKGERYWFVPHYIFWQRWRGDVIPGISILAQAYLLTGKPIYGHKCAVMLARIAEQYPQMNYSKQAYHHKYPTHVRGKILDYIWETSTISNFAKSYDAIYPATALETDIELAAFLKTKGITNLRATIERNIINEMIERLMDNTIRGNMGMPQRAMAGLALVLDNNDPTKGYTTNQLIEWILKTEPGKTTGETDDLFYNGFYRDGHGGESSPTYSAGWNQNFYTVAEDLEPLGINLFARPKMKKMADVLLDLTMIGQFSPSIGDSGSIKGAARTWYPALLQQAWKRYREPRYAQALKQLNFKDENLWEDPIEGEIEQGVKQYGTEINLSSRNLGGYGLGVLETGTGEHRRAVSMYYGSAAGGHGQRDRLTIEAWFFGKPVLTEHGYPAHWLPKNPYWTANTISHYAVVVNRKWQQNVFAGHLNFLATAPPVRVMEASAERVYPADVSLYRHTTAMIDLSPSHSYLFDVWRVRGGTQHDWSFHGFPFTEFSAPQLNWSPVQKQGTLASENVKFGETDAPDRQSGFQYLFNVQRAQAKGDFTSQWKSTVDDTALKVTLLNPPSQVIAADCEPELQPGAPETMKYLIARNIAPIGQTALQSNFAAVIEPIKGTGKIRSAQALQPLNPHPDFAGARVEYADEKGILKTDFVLSGMNAGTNVKLPNGVEFSGQFGVVSTDYLFLVNGTKLHHAGLSIHTQPMLSKIVALDEATNEITLDAKFAPNALAGRVVTISNDLHSTSYTIQSATNRDGKTVLSFGDVLPLIAEGRVTKFDAAKGEVATDTVLTGHGRVDGGRHEGRWLTDAKRTFKRKIKKFNGKVFNLDGPIPNGAFATRRFHIVDFNIGDHVQVPSIQFVRKNGAGQYQVQSTTPLTLTVPAINGESFIGAGATWQPLKTTVVGGSLTIRLDPAQFSNGEAALLIGRMPPSR